MFSTPRLIIVQWGSREVGTVDAGFLESLDSDQKLASFSLGGRPWRVRRVDWGRGVCEVEPTDDARAARWTGSPGFLSHELVQAMRGVLLDDEIDRGWSRRAQGTLASLREEASFLHDEATPMVSDGDEVTWWTYAGGRANMLLGRLIEAELGGRCVVRNTSITCRDGAGLSEAAVRGVVRRLDEEGRPNTDDAQRLARACAGKTRLSKFQPCLPDDMLDVFLAESLDVEGAQAVVKRAAKNAAQE